MSCSHSFAPVLLEWGIVVLDWPGSALNSTRLLESISMLDHSELSIQNNHVNLCPVSDLTTLLIVFQSNFQATVPLWLVFLPSRFKINVITDSTVLETQQDDQPFFRRSNVMMMMMMRGWFKLFTFLSMFLSIWNDMTTMKLLISIYLNK